jgi:hypothetical protein
MTAEGMPLVVDLDGTLTTRDTMVLQMGRLVLRRPHRIPAFMSCLRQSRAGAKAFLWAEVGLDVSRLRYSASLLQRLRTEHGAGRVLILATGAHHELAEAVAAHVGLFDDVIGSRDGLNVTGSRKAQILVDRFGNRGFDYAGNAPADTAVWAVSAQGMVCNAHRHVVRAARQVTIVVAVMDDRRYKGPDLARIAARLRP